MAITKTPTIAPFPVWNTAQEAGTNRYLPMVTPADMKKKSLFGIPLKSSLTGEILSDEAIQHYIDEAVSEIEHALDLYITPVTFEERHDYIRHQFTWHYNYTKLNHPNVLSVQKVELNFSNQLSTDPNQVSSAIDFPLEFVSLHPQEGALQLVPAFGTSFSGFLLSAMSGTQFYVLQHAVTKGVFPDAIRINYTCGFETGKIPAAIVALAEVIAAHRLLSSMGPILFPYNSVGVSIDGVSQSTSTPGPQFLVTRLTELDKQKAELYDIVKGYYQRRFILDYF